MHRYFIPLSQFKRRYHLCLSMSAPRGTYEMVGRAGAGFGDVFKMTRRKGCYGEKEFPKSGCVWLNFGIR